MGQIIPPGTPWPAKPQDYPTTIKPYLGKTTSNVGTKLTIASSQSVQVTGIADNSSGTTMSQQSSNPSQSSLRPSFAGSTGGNWESYVGQRVPPSNPWPEEDANQSISSITNKGDNFSTDITTEEENLAQTETTLG